MNISDIKGAWMTINRKCNLNCSWCYARDLEQKQDMSLNLALQIISFLRQFPIKIVVLIGGEPTIHRKFLKIIEAIKKADMEPALITNSITLANKYFLSDTTNAGIYAITTSLKGCSEDDYIRFTGNRGFYRTMEAIQNIQAKGIKHKVSIIVGRDVALKFNQLIEVLIEWRVNELTIGFEKPTIKQDSVVIDDNWLPSNSAEFIRKNYQTLCDSGIKFNFDITFPLCWFERNFLEQLIASNHAMVSCQMIKCAGIIVDPAGRLLPCNHFGNNPFSAKFGEDFANAQDYLRLRRYGAISEFYKTVKAAPNKRCLECDLWSKCGAGCRIYWLYGGSNNLLPINHKKGGHDAS